MMLCTRAEVMFAGKHIINFLTNFMTSELLQEATSGDLTKEDMAHLRLHTVMT